MGLVQCLVIFSMFSAQLVLTSPLKDERKYCELAGGRWCKKCPAGEYQKSCAECAPCPAGFYTPELNCESDCIACSRDCRAEEHLKVVQNCSSLSNMKCVCEEGFRCTHHVTASTNCRKCAKIQETTTTGSDKQTTSSASRGQSSTSTQHCSFPNCGAPSLAGNGTHIDGKRVPLEAILCPVALGCLALLILFFCQSNRDENGKETCFKRAIAKLCSEGAGDASHKPQESTHPLPRDSFSAKQQQPTGLSAANQVPVHVYNPGTVIFGLLNQFTGQVGPMIECGKKTERVTSEEEQDEEEEEKEEVEEERGCPVFHPTSSPSIHLSEEERSGEADSIFFPSQEQGKDCHVSKEEAL
ncbi:uncharacterized protein si:dkey-260g12.1 [Eleginops maclovinus]|uniref:uncharacterized protein si:dkey-260g12.1 n=1 Tax=Eleginops maclovinus TaxID=56733 RepID=UPI003080CD15